MNCVKNPISKSKKIKVGITLGDPAGIGPQILSDGLKRLRSFDNVELVIIGDSWALEGFAFSKKGITFIDLNNPCPKEFVLGKILPECGRLSLEYLKKAVDLIKNKEIECLVSLPITKESINKAGFFWPGHTEFLAEAFGIKNVVMMLLNRFLKVSLVTRHVAIRDISKQLNQDNIFETIKLTYEGLKKYFNIKNPKIAVSALNPHASDGGMFGDEEKRVILPAIEKAKDNLKNIEISGPFSSDTLFWKAKEGHYDAVVAMYHDQALIALKLTDFLHGVNLTLGLPFVRTSPLHGTALDIAGKKKASCVSFLEALNLAVRCTLTLKKICVDGSCV